MSRPDGDEHARHTARGGRRSARWLSLALVLLGAARCTFPEYDTRSERAGAAGNAALGGNANAGSGGTAGTAQQGGTGASVGGGPGESGAGTGAEGGAPVVCAGEQWPADRCEGGCFERYPDHCYDGEQDEDEVAPDCGGSCQRCTDEACTTNEDCLSGICAPNGDKSSCYAPLTLGYTAHERNAIVATAAWSIVLRNQEPADAPGFLLSHLKVRYYFERSGVTEPILTHGTQSTLKLASGESRSIPSTTWSIERSEPSAESKYDAYVEVAFGESTKLLGGDQIVLYQQLMSGDSAKSMFDQRSAYSFSAAPQDEIPSLHVAVFYRDELVWGLEPKPSNPRACFAYGVNLNGAALTIDGKAWQAATQARVTTTGTGVSQGGPPFPPVSTQLGKMLSSATRLEAGKSLQLPVDNGTYLAFLYATSPGDDADSSHFTLQGVEPESSGGFRPHAADGGQAWARLGPYRVDVTTGTLALAVTEGGINFAGVELWYPE